MTALDVLAWNLPALCMGLLAVLGILTASRTSADALTKTVETLLVENRKLHDENKRLREAAWPHTHTTSRQDDS